MKSSKFFGTDFAKYYDFVLFIRIRNLIFTSSCPPFPVARPTNCVNFKSIFSIISISMVVALRLSATVFARNFTEMRDSSTGYFFPQCSPCTVSLRISFLRFHYPQTVLLLFFCFCHRFKPKVETTLRVISTSGARLIKYISIIPQ